MCLHIRKDWLKYYLGGPYIQEENYAFYRETLGRMAILKWCCGQPMRKIIGHHKSKDGQVKNQAKGWSCTVCGHRTGLLVPGMA